MAVSISLFQKHYVVGKTFDNKFYFNVEYFEGYSCTKLS